MSVCKVCQIPKMSACLRSLHTYPSWCQQDVFSYRPISPIVFMLLIRINRPEPVCAIVIIEHNYMGLLMCEQQFVINIMLCL